MCEKLVFPFHFKVTLLIFPIAAIQTNSKQDATLQVSCTNMLNHFYTFKNTKILRKLYTKLVPIIIILSIFYAEYFRLNVVRKKQQEKYKRIHKIKKHSPDSVPSSYKSDRFSY